ncbi:MAG: chorismate synthase [bacterium]
MVRYLTAGESHGKMLSVIIDGIPAGLALSEQDINPDLFRRQQGFGRGDRMKNIEIDTVNIVSGVRWGETLGSPVTLLIANRDWENNLSMMNPDAAARDRARYQTAPRPGHADLAGLVKFDREDTRDILERASARETAARVAAGAVCRKLLNVFNIQIISWVVSIGDCRMPEHVPGDKLTQKKIELSPVRCPHKPTEKKIIELIKRALKKGDTLGGIFQVIVKGVPVGLGSCMQWDSRLDGRLAAALMSIQAVKGVEIGAGFSAAYAKGSSFQDEMLYAHNKGIVRRTNNAGGIEGGMSNGEIIVMRAAMKPIATLTKPLKSIDIRNLMSTRATVVRSDICAVPSAGVVGEAMVSLEIAGAMQEKFGGDSIPEMKRNYSEYMKRVHTRFTK